MKSIKSIYILLLLAFAANVSWGQSLTTTYAGGNGHSGVMFDVVATNEVQINSFDIHMETGSYNVEVYYKAGTFVGSATTPGNWTLLGNVAVTGGGFGNPTPIAIGGVTIPAGDTYAFYITVTNGTSVNYTNGTGVGNVLASNADISILEGAGVAYPFASTFTPRNFNGTVYYSPVMAVPIPTMGQWGLILLCLLTVTIGAVTVMRSQLALEGAGSASISLSTLPFDGRLFGKILPLVLAGFVLIFAVSVFAFGYEMTNADVPGSLLTAPVVAYLIHLFVDKPEKI